MNLAFRNQGHPSRRRHSQDRLKEPVVERPQGVLNAARAGGAVLRNCRCGLLESSKVRRQSTGMPATCTCLRNTSAALSFIGRLANTPTQCHESSSSPSVSRRPCSSSNESGEAAASGPPSAAPAHHCEARPPPPPSTFARATGPTNAAGHAAPHGRRPQQSGGNLARLRPMQLPAGSGHRGGAAGPPMQPRPMQTATLSLRATPLRRSHDRRRNVRRPSAPRVARPGPPYPHRALDLDAQRP